jgi:hypothetical protein
LLAQPCVKCWPAAASVMSPPSHANQTSLVIATISCNAFPAAASAAAAVLLPANTYTVLIAAVLLRCCHAVAVAAVVMSLFPGLHHYRCNPCTALLLGLLLQAAVAGCCCCCRIPSCSAGL